MSKPIYAIGAPDQPKLKVARTEIEAILKKHDLAGFVVLHTPGMAEFFYDIRPSYSCVWIDEAAQAVRVRSKLADYDGDLGAREHDRAATANMTRSLASELRRASGMFGYIAQVVDTSLGADHAEPFHVPDRNETGPRQ